MADLIRDTFKRGKYQDVILPLTVLRRLAPHQAESPGRPGPVRSWRARPRALAARLRRRDRPPCLGNVRATPGLQFLRRRLLAARSFPVHAGRPALAPFLLLKPTVSTGCRIPGRSRNPGEGAGRPAGRRSA